MTLNAFPTTIKQKLLKLEWPLVALVVLIAVIGFVLLYSAANGSFTPWAKQQMVRFAIGFILMLVIACLNIRIWFQHAYLLYGISFFALILVEIFGRIGKGAQRWIDLYLFQLQPSELIKISLIFALARYFHTLSTNEVTKPLYLIIPLCLVLLPTGAVMAQPDLGTALLLLFIGLGIFFVAGVRIYKFILVSVLGLASLPFIWTKLHDYQKNRILTFLDPERDPLGTGYHILQSKIAFGSGGLFGKGYMQGTQSHLNFLPEKQTDFIFSMLCEEFGMVGGIFVIFIYALVLFYAFRISFRCQSHFTRLLAFGITLSLFIYVFINMSMVMGLVPVVGVPLPLISYGGTSMLTLLINFGLLLSADLNHSVKLSRYGF